MIDSANILGFSGFILIISSQVRVHWRREYVNSIWYSLGNCVGGALLAVSLCMDWNLPSLISNIIWSLVNAYGVYRCLKYMRKNSAVTKGKSAK